MKKSRKNKSVLRRIRIALASLVFTAFVLLFANPGGAMDGILGFLANMEFWPAVLAANVGILVLIVASTMVLGRAYCSVMCPLGILQDIIYRIKTSGKITKKFSNSRTAPHNWLRYSILAAFIAAIALGAGSIAYLIEPYSIFGRMMSSLLHPGWVVGTISLATLCVIVFMVCKYGRLWCNTVCPVGAILSLLSRKTLLKPQIDSGRCVSCGLCGRACRASCIDTGNHSVDTSRCVLCFDCIDVCTHGAVTYGWKKMSDESSRSGKGSEGETGSAAEGLSRRAFLSASALAIGTAASAQQQGHGALAVLADKKVPQRSLPVIPPGASSLKAYGSKCVSCFLCVSACSNKVLRPSTEMGDMFLKPVMGFENGFCRPECTDCSQVCPSGAIKAVTAEEKSAISIGHAEFDLDKCVVATDGVHCGNCARHCPSEAILMVPFDGAEAGNDGLPLEIPVVNHGKCIGCGRCEYVCPSRPESAIHVEGNYVHQKL